MTVLRTSMKASSSLQSWVVQTLGFSLTVLLSFSPLTRAARDIGSMRQLVWSRNTATLEFCNEGSGNNVQYGYRQPGSGATCGDLAPLIVMSPGQTYELTLTNTIASGGDPANIHTHGLHISGDVRPTYFTGQADETPDDITVEAAPGESITYVWSIPSDHMGGTHWYHSHVHGHSNAQVDGGAYGMVIIEENGSISSDAGVNGWLDNEIVLMAGALGNAIKGNGVGGGDVFEIVANEWYRMRLAAADAGGTAKDLTISDSCEVRAVAHDGVWRLQVPKSGPSVNTYPLTGSSRLDVAIKCPTAGGPHEIKYKRSTVGILAVTSGSTSVASPWANGNGSTAWSPTRPAYLADLRGEQVDQSYSIQLTGGNINGESWNAQTPIESFNCNTVNEWTLSGSGAHPFHLHIHHMQIVTPGGCGDIYDEGEFVDTIDSDVGDCTVRFNAIDHCGRTVFHCHILTHEDTGAMGWVDFVEGGSGPTTPSTTPSPTPAPVAATSSPAPAPVLATTSPPTPAPIATTSSPTPAPIILEPCFEAGTPCGGRNSASCNECCGGVTGNGNNRECTLLI